MSKKRRHSIIHKNGRRKIITKLRRDTNQRMRFAERLDFEEELGRVIRMGQRKKRRMFERDKKLRREIFGVILAQVNEDLPKGMAKVEIELKYQRALTEAVRSAFSYLIKKRFREARQVTFDPRFFVVESSVPAAL